ncbi:MAG: helix-turn-helix domain-containing protein [Planctomycetes bacterium]|nr:helix-turn-helix domain-containing protein [Planctomycetota bacterium]
MMRYLGGPVRLEAVANAAGLSPFHFHRVFQSLVGVTLAEFVKRLRLERALLMMAHAPRSSLTKIAFECGFASSSDFSRCFKQRFGVAPSTFDMNGWRERHGAQLRALSPAKLHLDRLPERLNPDGFKVRIRALPARNVAYIRVRNPYRAGAVANAAARLIIWAERHGRASGQWLGYQWDNPEIASLQDCHYHVAVEAEEFTPQGEIGRFRFPPIVVAQVEIRGGIDTEMRALQWLFGSWLPRSGYVPDDQPCFEAWIGRPFAHGMEHFELHAQLPVKRG